MPTYTENEKEVYSLLARITDELNPSDFSSAEVVEEFGTLTTKVRKEGSDEKRVGFLLTKLVFLGYVERVERGRYLVTDAGMAFREESPFYDTRFDDCD